MVLHSCLRSPWTLLRDCNRSSSISMPTQPGQKSCDLYELNVSGLLGKGESMEDAH